MNNLTETNKDDTITESYTMRVQGGGISTSVSKKVVEEQAKKLKITVEDFLENYVVVIRYETVEFVGNFRKKQSKEEKK